MGVSVNEQGELWSIQPAMASIKSLFKRVRVPCLVRTRGIELRLHRNGKLIGQRDGLASTDGPGRLAIRPAVSGRLATAQRQDA
jgi:hypothetical protein